MTQQWFSIFKTDQVVSSGGRILIDKHLHKKLLALIRVIKETNWQLNFPVSLICYLMSRRLPLRFLLIERTFMLCYVLLVLFTVDCWVKKSKVLCLCSPRFKLTENILTDFDLILIETLCEFRNTTNRILIITCWDFNLHPSLVTLDATIVVCFIEELELKRNFCYWTNSCHAFKSFEFK